MLFEETLCGLAVQDGSPEGCREKANPSTAAESPVHNNPVAAATLAHSQSAQIAVLSGLREILTQGCLVTKEWKFLNMGNNNNLKTN